MARIDILLATHNGARFLDAQLASLDAQTFPDWRLIVRDDGSADDTPLIIQNWAQRTGRRITVLKDGAGNLGARDSFAALMAASDAPWFACCDQDDVWFPEKLAKLLALGEERESRLGASTPVLAYSDLEVVDADLALIAPSHHAYSGLGSIGGGRELVALMLKNVVTGCASLGNAALRETALPIPRGAIMHDWWLALVASRAGGLVAWPAPLVKYRQHGANVLGARDMRSGSRLRRYFDDLPAKRRHIADYVAATVGQARAFSERYAANAEEAQERLLQVFANSEHLAWPARRAMFARIAFKTGLTPTQLPLFLLG